MNTQVQTDLRLGQNHIGRHLETFVANATQQLLEANATQKEELNVMRSRLEHIQSGIERNTSVLWSKLRRPHHRFADVGEFVENDVVETEEEEQDSDVSDASEGTRCIDTIATLLQKVDPIDDGIEVDISVRRCVHYRETLSHSLIPLI